MPRMDGSGPYGAGPMTGRGFGPCSYLSARQAWGKGAGKMRGLGRYFGFGFPQDKKEQKSALERYSKALSEELEMVREQLKGL